MSEDLVQCVRTAGFEMEYAKFGNGPRPLVIIPGLAIKSVMKSASSLQVPYKMFTENFMLYFLTAARMWIRATPSRRWHATRCLPCRRSA